MEVDEQTVQKIRDQWGRSIDVILRRATELTCDEREASIVATIGIAMSLPPMVALALATDIVMAEALIEALTRNVLEALAHRILVNDEGKKLLNDRARLEELREALKQLRAEKSRQGKLL